MDQLWSHGPASAEACRAALAAIWPMKASTMRTVLRRLEAKGYLDHAQHGRSFIYRAREARAGFAARAVRNIIERFCGGSAEELVLGLVENKVLQPEELQQLARRLTRGRKP